MHKGRLHLLRQRRRVVRLGCMHVRLHGRVHKGIDTSGNRVWLGGIDTQAWVGCSAAAPGRRVRLVGGGRRCCGPCGRVRGWVRRLRSLGPFVGPAALDGMLCRTCLLSTVLVYDQNGHAVAEGLHRPELCSEATKARFLMRGALPKPRSRLQSLRLTSRRFKEPSNLGTRARVHAWAGSEVPWASMGDRVRRRLERYLKEHDGGGVVEQGLALHEDAEGLGAVCLLEHRGHGDSVGAGDHAYKERRVPVTRPAAEIE